MPIDANKWKQVQGGFNKATAYDPNKEAAEKQAARDKLDSDIESAKQAQLEIARKERRGQ